MEQEDKTLTNEKPSIKNPEQEDSSKNTVIAKKKTSGKRIQRLLILLVFIVTISSGTWLLWLQPLLKNQQFTLTELLPLNTQPRLVIEDKANLIDVSVPENLESSQITAEPSRSKEEVAPPPNKIIRADDTYATIVLASAEPIIAESADQHLVLTEKSKSTEVPQITINHSNREALHQELVQLHTDIKTLRKAITELHHQQKVQQRKALSYTLNKLLSPSISFSEQVLLWQNIGNELELSIVEKQQVDTIIKLAQQNVIIAREWQSKLERMLHAFDDPTAKNIIPNNYWWQKWIREHVSLHREVSGKNQQNKKNLAIINYIIRSLLQDQWPDIAVWQGLRQNIISKTLALDLAHDIAIVEKNKATMDHLAKQWRDQLS